MWIQVQWREKLEKGDKIRVTRTGHEAVISLVTKQNNCYSYEIDPKDPKDWGGHWFFSHFLEKDIKYKSNTKGDKWI